MMRARFFWYAKCSTCRKAQKLLRERGVQAEVHDLGQAAPARADLEEMWRGSGLPLKRFFNTSGQSYRQGGFRDRMAEMSDEEMLDALAADGMLVKRPLLHAGDRVLVGFEVDNWNSTFDTLQGTA